MSYYKVSVEAGKTIEVYKSFTRRVGVKMRGIKSKPTAAEMDKVNRYNAVRKLRIKINANFKEDDFFITLTYRKDERPTPAAAKENIKAVIDGLRKKYKEAGEALKYIHVTEYENKAIHHHLLINDSEVFKTTKAVRELWPFGRPHFKPLDDTGQYKDLAEYIVKETDKTRKKEDGGYRQRYTCSRNLHMPEPEIKIIEKAMRWLPDPRAKKGYYIDLETVYNSVDPFTGCKYQRYTMIKLPGKGG